MASTPLPAPANDTNHEEHSTGRWLLWLFLGMLAVAVTWWFYFDSTARSLKNWWGRSYLPAVTNYIQSEDWAGAARELRLATRWAPNDPDVLRSAIDFGTRTRSDPRTMIRFLSLLEESGEITIAERCHLGRMQVHDQDLKSARAIYDSLPQEELAKRPALELLATIQNAEGLHGRAFLTQRKALLADPDDPESVLQLALMDARSGDASLSGPARERLWPIVRGGGTHTVPAIEYLANHRQLTAGEAEELLAVIESMPTSPMVIKTRLDVLSAVLRTNPHRRQDLLNQELQRWTGMQPANLPPLLAWLINEREYERVLRIVSAKTAAVYSAVLPHYIAALRGEKKWAEIKTMLASKIDPGFSRAQIRLWLAEAESKLSDDPSTPRQILSSLFDESGGGDQAEVTRRTAEVAEELGFWDIARRCYEGISSHHPELAMTMQVKVYDMALHELNGTAMLAASERLRDIKKTDVIFLDRVNYLRLLLGTDIEVAQRALDLAAEEPQHHITQDRQIALSLLRALAAYRSGQKSQIQEHLAKVHEIDTFPPGPRAVYAGLLAVTGDTAGAFRVAELVPNVLLLPEERRFLGKAL